ncbi:hypothetical protein [Legionella pneumophila]|jgi:hypothetical protein|uniref:hypothetical protein n=1 Tax=Legionella pneumophila TaxID=446 RepID=UPI0002C0F151|nr:hypothetical protein [Legionella pneumophila]AGH55360.1 putative protein [Legionella pneumophila subsp. pneumophila LPE509]MCW8442388.1 hypothetical protein [Legionella pneumophila]
MNELNPKLIYQLASEAFWEYVALNDFSQASLLLSDNIVPLDMWSMDILQHKLNGISSEEVLHKEDVLLEILEAAHNEIMNYFRAERNLLGMFYLDELENCIPQNFDGQQYKEILLKDSDSNANYEISANHSLPKIGYLSLRTPLPAVVITDKKVEFNIIEVNSTEIALGFPKRLILEIQEIIPMTDSKYILSGIFRIITDEEFCRCWTKLIPNSNCLLEGYTAYYSDSGEPLKIEKKQKTKSVLHRWLSSVDKNISALFKSPG